MKQKTVLIITDGIGHNESTAHNAFKQAKTPTYDHLFENIPYSLIKTSGQSVGLPKGQMGNSEVGHMTIGTGRVLYQDLVKINRSIEDNQLPTHPLLLDTIERSNAIHLIGLMSNGGVHSHIDHMIALINAISQHNRPIYLHLITDGRDVAPQSALDFLEKISHYTSSTVRIATLGGRYYTMDRDNRWDRIEKGYQAIVQGKPSHTQNFTPKEYIQHSYEKEITDEFILPTAFGDYSGFKDNDGVIFCNFRSDRMRELSCAIAKKEFASFPTQSLTLNILTMTQYDETLPLPTLFPKEIPTHTLAQVISDSGLSQLHTAETEKYAHVTFFFNGGIEEPYLNESRVLIPSPTVDTYDLKPEMSAKEVGEAVTKAMDEAYDFIVVNFANGDMVGHTGNFESSIQAVEAVDKELGHILEKAKQHDYAMVLTSDHGNCERMRDHYGNILTNHTTTDVYCFVMSPHVKRVQSGGLNNVAATVLKLMDIPKPNEMDEALI